MSKPYKLALHVFRRDLRLHDNTALLQALHLSNEVLPCFIFDQRQLETNDYKSDNCVQFMAHSLQELDHALREKESQLYFFYGIAEDIIQNLIHQLNIEAVFINRDYTPFSKKRDQRIKQICQASNIDFHCYADALLQEPEQTLKADKTPYTVFTPFFKNAALLPVQTPVINKHDNYYRQTRVSTDTTTLEKLLQKKNLNLSVQGGRREAAALLKKLKTLSDYRHIRDIPALDATTKLSAHNKFGTLSIRELYHYIVKQFGQTHTLINELYWRDFFTHITFHFPRVLGHAFHEKYDALKWSENETHFRAWCEGNTGFPIVDAGMRELNTTGFMHNRVRMITASFLTKDLHINWRWGEKYFAQKLVDYDPAVNNGNWQWAASTGCDAQPYFRIFNPWLQQQKFDAECLYIKRWIIELAHLSPKHIHELPKYHGNILSNYPKPIVEHAHESQIAKQRYKNINPTK